MSQWHRENPELFGTSADPWMIHDGYRKAVATTERECPECGRWARLTDDGVCGRCDRGEA